MAPERAKSPSETAASPRRTGTPTTQKAARIQAPATRSRVRVDGKLFSDASGSRFPFRGVTYGTFAPRADGALYPERHQIKRDIAAMSDAGLTVLRTYTPPPDDLIEIAGEWGMYVLAGVSYADWRHLLSPSRRELRQVAREARSVVRHEARRLREHDHVLALSVGNEVPADAIRWFGTRRVADVLADLVDVVRQEDPERLVTYANYPTTEWLPLESLDFLMFNVFLERRADFRRYLTRLHHLAGERPVVLGEIGLNAGGTPEGEQEQAEALDWQLEIACERGIAGYCVFSWTDEWWVEEDVEGWAFGMTRRDRSPRPSLEVARSWSRRTVADLKDEWPSMSVVICAHNAASTLDECLHHTCSVDYPNLEILVVDDGSTDATPQIVRRHPRAQLVQIDHGGLSAARNEGYARARGELIAYLDSDAYPSPEWPYYLVLSLDAPSVGGTGGPNIPPPDDPSGAQAVARAPGGPVHVLLAHDRAEHVPGCNMAFYRYVLEEVGGFDPVYRAAGDDVDVCWKVLDGGWEIAFHPAALVWHHRRPGMRTYLRQQKGYGRAEALVEARHPDRFTPLGTARWRGRIYDSIGFAIGRQRVYRGLYGLAAYQSVYGGGGHLLDLVHQAGLPLAILLLATAPLALIDPALGSLAVAAFAGVLALGAVDAWRTPPVRGGAPRPRGLRLRVALLHLLQPLMRSWGRLRHAPLARRDLPPPRQGPVPVRPAGRRVLVGPADRPRLEATSAAIEALRRAGLRAEPATGWEDHDARFLASLLLAGDLVTSAHLKGCIQFRVRRRLRPWRIAALSAILIAGIQLAYPLALLAVLVGAVDTGRGLWRTGPLVRRTLTPEAGNTVEGDV